MALVTWHAGNFDREYNHAVLPLPCWQATAPNGCSCPAAGQAYKNRVDPAAGTLSSAICMYGMCGKNHGQPAEKEATVVTVTWDNRPLQRPLL